MVCIPDNQGSNVNPTWPQTKPVQHFYYNMKHKTCSVLHIFCHISHTIFVFWLLFLPTSSKDTSVTPWPLLININLHNWIDSSTNYKLSWHAHFQIVLHKNLFSVSKYLLIFHLMAAIWLFVVVFINCELLLLSGHKKLTNTDNGCQGDYMVAQGMVLTNRDELFT